MVSAGILLIIPKYAFSMNEKKVTINAMIAYRIAEARRHDYSESGIWVYTESIWVYTEIPRPLT